MQHLRLHISHLKQCSSFLFVLLKCIEFSGFYLQWQDGISRSLPSWTQTHLERERERSSRRFRLCELCVKECNRLQFVHIWNTWRWIKAGLLRILLLTMNKITTCNVKGIICRQTHGELKCNFVVCISYLGLLTSFSTIFCLQGQKFAAMIHFGHSHCSRFQPQQAAVCCGKAL